MLSAHLGQRGGLSLDFALALRPAWPGVARTPGPAYDPAAWIVLVIARTYGEPPGLGAVLGVLPDMSHVAFYRYADPTLELAVIILAALGMDSLTTQPAPGLAAGCCHGRVVGSGCGSDHRGGSPRAQNCCRLPSRLLAEDLLFGLSRLSPRAASPRCSAAPELAGCWLRRLSLLDALVLFVLPELSAPRSVTIDTAPVAYLQRHQGLSRFATLGPLQPNYGSYFGLPSLNTRRCARPHGIRHLHQRALGSHGQPNHIQSGHLAGRPPGAPTSQQELLSNLNGYRAAGVRYVLAPAGDELPLGPDAFTIVFRSPTTLIYRLAGASSYFTTTNPTCTVNAQSGESARVSCSTSTTLVRRETYMPGWSAEVDGHAQSVRAL